MKTYWVTKNGNKVFIENMTMEHIINSIKHLEKVFRETNGERAFCDCFGDVDSFDVEIYNTVEDMFPIIIALKKELIKRQK